MQHVSDQQYRRPWMGSLTRYADWVRAVFTGWRRLCVLMALLCGAAVVVANENSNDAFRNLGDFNGDGKDDVLLRHEDGRWFYYPMDGRRHITSQRGLADLTRKLDWQVAGIGDFNEDGKDDVLLRHEDGRWFYYPMNGRRHITSQRGLADLTRKLDWQVAGIGDFNEDGKDDVLLRHEDGRWFYYPMDGRRHITSQRGLADLTRKLDWRVAGIGDFNGDGKDDVLLRHTDGRWFYYPMDGRRHITSQRGLADLTRNLDWQVAGIGDFNDDGKDDVLLRHEDGRWFYYPMDGRRHITSQRGLADLTRKLDWRVAGIGDFNEDGKDDVLLRHEDGRWFYYPMDGRRHITSQRGLADLTRNLGWSLAGTGSAGGDGGSGDDHSNTRTGATTLALGGSASGRIEPGSDVDYFIVQVTGTGTLTVYTTGSLDTTGELQDNSGSRLAFNDDAGTGTNFQIEHSVSSGAYYIEVGSYQSNTGNYTLHTEFSGSDGTGGGGNAPDLTVDTPTVSNNNPDAGATFTLRATVRNRGDGSAEATTLRYYRSTDSTITRGDTSVGTDPVSALSASDSSSESINLSAPADVGTWYYGACVNAVDGESDTGNNCSDGVRVIVEDDEPEMPIDIVASYSNIQVAFNQETPNEISFSLDLNAFNTESREPASITSLRTPSRNYSNGIQQRYALQSISCASPGSRFSYNALLLFDRSGSMSGNDPQGLTLDAGKEFARRINSLGHGLIAQFSTFLPSQVEFITPQFTNNSSQLIMDINSINAPDGGTPLWDAMIESIDRLNQSSSSVNKSALITFSDGEDTSSANSDSSVLRRALGDQILVYSVNLRNSDSHDLDNIALRTGGSAYSTDEASRLLAFYGTLGNLLSGNTSTCTTQINARVEAQDGRALGYGPGGSLQIDLEFSGNTDSGEGTALVENISMPFRFGERRGATSTGVPVFASDFGETGANDCTNRRLPLQNNCTRRIYISACNESLAECKSGVVDSNMQFNPFAGVEGRISWGSCYWDSHNDQTFIPVLRSGAEPNYLYETFEERGESDNYHCVYSKRLGN